MTATIEPPRPRGSGDPSDRSRAAQPAPVLSPTVRQTSRRAVPWLVLAAIAVLVTVFGVLLTGRGQANSTPLDAGNAAPIGGKALAQVLGRHGVDVRSATTLDQVHTAAGDDTTILIYDPAGNLSPQGYDEVSSVASTLVVVEPDFQALQRLAPGVRAAGAPHGVVAAGCAVPAAQRAERIDPRATPDTKDTVSPGSFRAQDDAADCFVDGDGRASLVRTNFDGRTVFLVGSAAVFTNDGIEREGNAALALSLLGAHRTLVWYLPGLLDRPVTGPADLSALTPGWVTPVVILLVLVFLAAAIWRGRRFGPLVVENLPVVVRAGETREGRARLYQRSSARLRAADALRIGAIGRLAGLAGLARASSTVEVADAVAALTGRDRMRILGLLLDDLPRTDADLIALSDALAELERATAAAVSPGQPGPTGRMEA